MNIFKPLALVALLGLAGCQTSNSATDAARITGAYAFTFYGSVYQPMLAQYAKLPTCGTPAQPPCKDKELYRKLYALDAAVADCAVAAQRSLSSEFPDFPLINSCIQQVELAKFEFAKDSLKVTP
jgi:hypothetical protein